MADLSAYNNIPLELRQLNQWCCWRLEDIGAVKPTKPPYQINGQLANVNDSSTWNSFNNALNALSNPPPSTLPFTGIGFVFGIHDPYCVIDLDDPCGDPVITDRQIKVFREFDSYSEVSPSGKGLHIIGKGSIPSGRRRSSIEIYSSGRYITMTGQVYHNKPIADIDDLINQLYEQMGGGPAQFVYTNEPQKAGDKDIIEYATKAINGDKFSQLLMGNWNDLYPSQSEADQAFINIVAFYTQNREQITRIFRQSPLGARVKARSNSYIELTINKAFDQMLPPIDIDGFKILQEKFIASTPVAQRLEPTAHNGLVAGSNPAGSPNKAGSFNGKTTPFEGANIGSTPIPASIFNTDKPFKLEPPPGLIGAIARFIYEAAPRQIPEVAIAAALGLMAGVCGKAYNISGTGLNQYIILVANTGSGKESMASGIDKLINAIKLMVPTATDFLGPAEIASGQALVKYINQNHCFVSILGEFGIRMQGISNPNANSHERMLLRILLDLYNKSGAHQSFRSSIYADKEKNIGQTLAPSFSVLAESTPETFYSVLNEDMVSAGLLPRFLIVEYKGKVPYLNRNSVNVEPSLVLQDQFASLVANAQMIMHANKVIPVSADADADKILKDFETYATDKVNANDKDFVRQLWNRAHMKALKVSALIAVGVNMIEPVVRCDYVMWAIDLVVNDIKVLAGKFDQGEIGNSTSEWKQLQFMKKTIRGYMDLEWDKADSYKVDKRLFDDKLIQGAYISRRVAGQPQFRLDRNGTTHAIKRSIQALIDCDAIREVPTSQLQAKYGTRQKVYVISNPKMLGE